MRKILILATILAILATFLYIFDPISGPIPYPRCWIKLLTGYDCPGCGSARALHALLHGRLSEAWHFNPAIFLILPLIGATLAAEHPRCHRLRRLLLTPASVAGIIALTLAWTLLRNLP
ncbi:MAG: DUF2752 domain-containing protein [Muribaculaceae bacterium]|nr:DUF2752 domain-containing protein [Muribaculaceae bacterium]